MPLPAGLALLRRLTFPRKLGLLERVYGRALAARGTAWVITAGGVRWKLDLTDVTQRWIVYGDYEGRAQMGWIRRWLADGGTVVDSGASVGQMLLHLAPLPGVRVHAFEPVAESAAWLRECLALQTGWQVELTEAALTDAPGTVEIQVAGPHSTVHLEWYRDQRNPRASVPALTLDGYAAQRGIDRIRLWKLDVEGAEPQALAGAAGLIGEGRIDALLVEVSAGTRASIEDMLAHQGYRAMGITSASTLAPVTGTTSATANLVFAKPSS